MVGKTADNEAYEVVMTSNTLLGVRSIEDADTFFDYDPTAPDRNDVLASGLDRAIRRSSARFLSHAVKNIHHGCHPGYEQCCREIANSRGLGTALERSLLC